MNQTRAGPFQKRGEWVSFPVMKAATYYAVLLALVLGAGCCATAPKTASPAEFAQMLEAADDELLPLIAIQGFCGPRQKEVMRMTWENVWRVPGYIELNADQTKTRQRRLVPRSASLEQWVNPVPVHSANPAGHTWNGR